MCSAKRCIVALCFLWLVFTSLTGWCGKRVFTSATRLRYEFQNNFNQKYYGSKPPFGKKNNGFLLGRFRLGADWFPSNTLHLALWVQESRAWDWAMPDRVFYKRNLDTYNNPEKDYAELYTTYIEIKRIFNLPLALKAGRQRIAYGDHRVFGPGQWGNSGRYIWDAVKFRVGGKKAFVDLFYGRNMLHHVHRFSLKHRHDKSTLAAYGHIQLAPSKGISTTLEPFLFTKWDRHDRFKGELGGRGKLLLTYGGLHWTGRWGVFDWNHTWIGTWGKRGPDPVTAYAYHVEGGVIPPIPVKTRLYLAYSYASGDKNPKDNRCNRFDGAFGSVDKAYGRMNLFKWSNLEDTEGGVELWPISGLHLKAEYHHFRLAQSRDGWSHNPALYRDRSGASGKEMGHEFDLVAEWKLSPSQEVETGYGHFWPGEFVKREASSSQANWFFLQYRLTLRSVL